MPDPFDYDFSDPLDAHWFEHDMNQWAMFLRVYGDDEPVLSQMQATTDRVRGYLRLHDQLWTEIRETTIA